MAAVTGPIRFSFRVTGIGCTGCLRIRGVNLGPCIVT